LICFDFLPATLKFIHIFLVCILQIVKYYDRIENVFGHSVECRGAFFSFEVICYEIVFALLILEGFLCFILRFVLDLLKFEISFDLSLSSNI